jgi:asparaginyl-tRNA synthetase
MKELLHLRCNDVKHTDYIGKEVTIRGWVHRLRKQKENTFMLIRDDRGGVIQCILSSEKAPNLTIESCIEVMGKVRQDSRAPEGGYEIKAADLKIYALAKVGYPIGEYQSEDLLLDNRHLAVRTRRMNSIAKLRASILKYARQWFIENNWLEVNTPSIVKDSVEGGSTLFEVRYFDEEAYLSQSAQLYLEAMVFSLGPVWSITESFRAEKSRTVRHLAEFTHLEAEAPWIILDDILRIQEQLILYIVQNTVKENSADLGYLKRDLTDLKSIETPFDKLSYEKVIEILRSKDFTIIEDNGTERKIEWGDDLNIDSERELTKNRTRPIFVVDFPILLKPFYVKEDDKKRGTGLSADMLAPRGFGEISSGGERETDITSITKRIQKEALDPKNYEWYLDLRRYGSVPHAGFGLGIERLVRWVANLEDIKDTVLFPRTMSRVRP